MIDLKSNPFYLNDEQIQWVQQTFEGMTTEEKAGHVLCPVGNVGDTTTLTHYVNDIKIGAMMFRPGPAEEIRAAHTYLQEHSRIPLLLAANAESGGTGMVKEGTSFGQCLAIAATDNSENAYRMAKAALSQSACVGMNWSFAPVVDIDLNFRNPITNIRSFGDDADRIIEFAGAYMKAADEEQVAVTLKHFPGDGSDERDQHIVTSVNCLDADDWRASYGKIYRTLIRQGAKAIMAGHIAQPSLAEALCPEADIDTLMLPSSLSKILLTDVLRGEIGFNGLITTDSSLMIGFSALPRCKAVPTAIESGCDILLFNRNIDEDFEYILKGLEDGVLSKARLDEAVLRILATKASLGLIEKKAVGTLVPTDNAPLNNPQYIQWAKEVADQAITLVKDRPGLLPLNPKTHPKVCLNYVGRSQNPEGRVPKLWKEMLEKEGFIVTLRDRRANLNPFNLPAELSPAQQQLLHEMTRSVEQMKQEVDLYIYIAHVPTASNYTSQRLDWKVIAGLGDDAPWIASEVPTLMVSLGSPYHLFDAPQIPTYINAYSSSDLFCKAAFEKLMGRSQFKGKNPVDPFCSNKYIRLLAEK